jgi:hypothetical protein
MLPVIRKPFPALLLILLLAQVSSAVETAVSDPVEDQAEPKPKKEKKQPEKDKKKEDPLLDELEELGEDDYPDLVGVDEEGEIIDEFAFLKEAGMVELAARHRQKIGMSASPITVITR